MSEAQDNRAVYETFYGDEHLSISRPLSPYDRAYVDLRLRNLERLCRERDVADLGCGTGAYLLPVARIARSVYGVDFSTKLLSLLRARVAADGAPNVRLVQADVRAIPLRSASMDVAFSIATLYHVPRVELAIAEMGRIVRPAGRLLVELGNRWSLNTLVAQRAESGTHSYHIGVGEMRAMLGAAGFRIDEHRRFQLLPMYGGPLWLRPLVSAHWKKIMGRSLGGRLIDEHVSSLPLLRALAFRHLFVCTRRA